ncbi:MAG TPA: putative toxin-antitoxin system toxin component, PIN family, partial [Candidatus Angelobacter sp.]|nr:putative toxin-antitoxin system toxin component, PIN family [Candidatus Angelobacter sp.]
SDSNIYVSALQFGGVPLQFLNAARNGAFRLAISEALIAEIRGVLLEKFRWPEERLDEAIANLLDFTQLVKPTYTVSVIADDPDDDRIIECAIASSSQFIVSGDKHLLRLTRYENIRILKVSEFLALVPKP